MKMQTYMALVEEQFDQPLELERLEVASERDPELDDLERTQVQERIGQYRNDEARMHFAPDVGDSAGEEQEA